MVLPCPGRQLYLHQVYPPVAEGEAKNGATRQDATAAVNPQEDGTKAFVQSWSDLIGVIESKQYAAKG